MQAGDRRRLVFDHTVEQSVHAMTEWYRWSPQARRSKRVSTVLFVIVLVVTMTYLDWRESNVDPLGLAISAAVAALFGVVYWFGYDYSVRRRTRKFIREMTGGRDHVASEVTWTDQGLRSKSAGVETAFDWDTCVDVRETPDGIHFVFRAGPGYVPSHAFVDAAQREDLLTAARRGQRP